MSDETSAQDQPTLHGNCSAEREKGSTRRTERLNAALANSL